MESQSLPSPVELDATLKSFLEQQASLFPLISGQLGDCVDITRSSLDDSSLSKDHLEDSVDISRSSLEDTALTKDLDTVTLKSSLNIKDALLLHHDPDCEGKSCGKESPEKKDETELWGTMEAQTAFLGPNLWEKTLPYDTDLKYVDLDEFLSENGIPVEGGVQPTQLPSGSGCLKEPGRMSPTSSTPQVLPKREPSPVPSEAMSPLTISPPSPAESTLSFASSSRDAFDPRTRAFSDEELKPQPMVKKSRKQFVPEGLKDEKYWARRRKNNMAAKRSRDARRMKENQIALRAGFLEKENLGLRQEMDRLKKENLALRDRLSKFTNEI